MTQPMIDLRTTPYGGRSIFAIQPIAQGIHILACETPFAHVIYKDYRREVCAQCFAYAASASRNIGDPRTWSIRSCRAASESVWFCTDECKIAWESGMIGPLIADTNALLAKAQIATRKKVKGRRLCHDSPDPILPNGPTATLQITQDHIDEAWTHAEDLASSPARLSSYCSAMDLEDMELETSRSVASAIVQRYVFDCRLADLAFSSKIATSDPWTEVLRLQNSELSNVRLRPYILVAHLRVYAFLCHSLPQHLRPYVPTIRNLLARDTGNAFGIWDGDSRDEMLGWGVWVGASYFNHSCCPNVKKTRVGRTMQFTTSRSVETGEELCISYIDINQTITQRRQELEDSWFFTCQCQRCQSEDADEACLH
ncbi:SET domain-containing protein [Suillus paluster]|uniref:SET domain-containing protein n=1 Tax=Suillus paluster TaxID=48578 RepID=UPI001B86A067|nr:SET domain-containing protein [Suillus paluster]KAG1737541.1 SET domain-containing protein [Suillus paluster]